MATKFQNDDSYLPKDWVRHPGDSAIGWAALRAPLSRVASIAGSDGSPGWIEISKQCQALGDQELCGPRFMDEARARFDSGQVVRCYTHGRKRSGALFFSVMLASEEQLAAGSVGTGYLSQLRLEVEIAEVLALAKVRRERASLERASNAPAMRRSSCPRL